MWNRGHGIAEGRSRSREGGRRESELGASSLGVTGRPSLAFERCSDRVEGKKAHVIPNL